MSAQEVRKAYLTTDKGKHLNSYASYSMVCHYNYSIPKTKQNNNTCSTQLQLPLPSPPVMYKSTVSTEPPDSAEQVYTPKFASVSDATLSHTIIAWVAFEDKTIESGNE